MIRVAITEDHPLIVSGIREILDHAEGMELVHAYPTAAASNDGLAAELPDVLLLDIHLPDGDGVDLCKEYKRLYPELRIIALTTYNQTMLVKNMMKNGASGYLLKNTSREELLEAISKVHQGEQYLQNEIKEALLSASLGESVRPSYMPKLTRREKEVLELIVEELTTAEIAERLFISPKTVESHRLNLIQKLGVRNSAGLVKEAITKDLIG
ncbi:MAG: response regulator transcription factor [Flavobacteriales bacterium]|nr:response regulator transcription factor [Flavobacteriales bacterium]